MTVDQEIRAAALQAVTTIVAGEPDVWDTEDFRDALKRYETYIKHGEWNE